MLMNINEIEAVRLWKSYPAEYKNLWLNNAFCSNCGVTSFKEDYFLQTSEIGVVIKGTCSNCGAKIARVCD